MASASLYPPIVDSYTPAFITGIGAKCTVNFSLSKFSSSASDIKSIHLSVVKQDTGMSVIDPKITEDDKAAERFRQTGILIINVNGLTKNSVDILNSDIQGGWTAGWVYKIQIRFSTEAYDPNETKDGLAAWLNNNADKFSEWSTYTLTKAIAEPKITIPILGIENNESTGTKTLLTSTLEFSGYYSNDDVSESLYSYRLQLLQESDLLEDSGWIYANQYVPNQFYYLFKTELKNDSTILYKVRLEYETINKYQQTRIILFRVDYTANDIANIQLLTAESDLMKPYTSIEEEETDGRVALKFSSSEESPYTGNIYIRRSDITTGFTKWEDIKIFTLNEENINNIPIFYDYTIESGVWYQYGFQILDSEGQRTKLHTINNETEFKAIMREFDSSYLLGENGQQLKLTFNNTMGSFKTNYSESKIDTIGSKFPFITRNGNMRYRTFPINGLISFNMDENNLFATKKDIYKYDDVVKLYESLSLDNPLYNYTYERDFRKKVMEFLEDGKPKLFKSPTEGNIIVRLMDINTTPNDTLGRLIYSFTSTASEVADSTVDNYKKYNFLF